MFIALALLKNLEAHLWATDGIPLLKELPNSC
jgi:hypothetical protein